MDHPPDIQLRDDSKRVRFDGTINAGHLLTALLMGGALVTMWANAKVVEANHTARIEINEHAINELRDTTKSLANAQMQSVLTEQKLSMTLEYLAKQRQQP